MYCKLRYIVTCSFPFSLSLSAYNTSYIYIYAYSHVYTYICIYKYTRTKFVLYIYIYIYLYIHTHTHTHQGHFPREKIRLRSSERDRGPGSSSVPPGSSDSMASGCLIKHLHDFGASWDKGSMLQEALLLGGGPRRFSGQLLGVPGPVRGPAIPVASVCNTGGRIAFARHLRHADIVDRPGEGATPWRWLLGPAQEPSKTVRSLSATFRNGLRSFQMQTARRLGVLVGANPVSSSSFARSQ